MSENLNIWNRVKAPPKDALKKIGGGRLKGMTDIRPQWRYLVMTDVFGPIGIGWKYTINKMWLEAGTDGQMCAFADVSLYYKQEGEWSDAIPGIGGSMYVANEKNGAYTSDEAYKMAVTDALSVAMKTLGVAADIYMGFDPDSKYEGKTDDTAKSSENKEKKDVSYWKKKATDDCKTADKLKIWRATEGKNIRDTIKDESAQKELRDFLDNMQLELEKDTVDCPKKPGVYVPKSYCSTDCNEDCPVKTVHEVMG